MLFKFFNKIFIRKNKEFNEFDDYIKKKMIENGIIISSSSFSSITTLY